MNYQVIISGFGGQGVVFISKILAQAAMKCGFPVFTSETHGMAQRGGTVISHIRIGDFAGPLIKPGDADALIALKQETVLQYSYFLKDNSTVFVNYANTCAIENRSAQVYCLDADKTAAENNNLKSVNLAMLGFFAAYFEKQFNISLVSEIKKEKALSASINVLNAGYTAFK